MSVSIYINKNRVEAEIDTGSVYLYISVNQIEEVLKSSNMLQKVREYWLKFFSEGVHMENLMVSADKEGPLMIHTFRVVEMSKQVVLGWDFMTRHDCTWDVSNCKLLVRDINN